MSAAGQPCRADGTHMLRAPLAPVTLLAPRAWQRARPVQDNAPHHAGQLQAPWLGPGPCALNSTNLPRSPQSSYMYMHMYLQRTAPHTQQVHSDFQALPNKGSCSSQRLFCVHNKTLDFFQVR